MVEYETRINEMADMLQTSREECRQALKSLSQVKQRAKRCKCNLVLQNEAQVKELKEKIRENGTHKRIRAFEFYP